MNDKEILADNENAVERIWKKITKTFKNEQNIRNEDIKKDNHDIKNEYGMVMNDTIRNKSPGAKENLHNVFYDIDTKSKIKGSDVFYDVESKNKDDNKKDVLFLEDKFKKSLKLKNSDDEINVIKDKENIKDDVSPFKESKIKKNNENLTSI